MERLEMLITDLNYRLKLKKEELSVIINDTTWQKWLYWDNYSECAIARENCIDSLWAHIDWLQAALKVANEIDSENNESHLRTFMLNDIDSMKDYHGWTWFSWSRYKNIEVPLATDPFTTNPLLINSSMEELKELDDKGLLRLYKEIVRRFFTQM